MGACCGGMKSGQNKSLPENEKANNIEDKDKCANGPQGDAAVAKETPDTTDQQQQQQSPPDQEAPVNHTAEPPTVAPEEVELKITEPDRPEPQPVPVVCPVAEKPAVCPEQPPVPTIQPTDVGVEKDESCKPSTEVLFVSEDGDVVRPKNESTSEVITTTETEHTQMSCTMQATEVRTTTVDEMQTATDEAFTSVQKDEMQQEVGKVGDVEQLKHGDDVVASPDAEFSQMPSSSVVEQTSLSAEVPAVTGEADHSEVAVTAGSEDHQKHAETDVVAETAAAEVIVAERAVDAEQVEQVPEEALHSHETVGPTDTEQLDTKQHADQLSTPTEPAASEVVDTTAAATFVEPVVEGGKHEETSAEAVEQQTQPQQHPATDDVEVTTEQTPHTGTMEVEAPSVSVETPVPAEVTAVAHEELHTALEETAQHDNFEAANMPNTESISSPDAAWPVVDESVSKPEDATNSPVEVGEVQPEELPPPLTPENENASAPGSQEIQQQAESNDCRVEPPNDVSEQPEQHAVNDSIDNVEEPSSKSTSEVAEHAGEVPVIGEP